MLVGLGPGRPHQFHREDGSVQFGFLKSELSCDFQGMKSHDVVVRYQSGTSKKPYNLNTAIVIIIISMQSG